MAIKAAFLIAEKVYGLPEFVPYDLILVSAAATELPTQLLEQLKIGGRMVVPTRTTIHVIDKERTRTIRTANTRDTSLCRWCR